MQQSDIFRNEKLHEYRYPAPVCYNHGGKKCQKYVKITFHDRHLNQVAASRPDKFQNRHSHARHHKKPWRHKPSKSG